MLQNLERYIEGKPMAIATPIFYRKVEGYGRKAPPGDFAAMVHLIHLAWNAHTRATGDMCPFDFEDPGGTV